MIQFNGQNTFKEIHYDNHDIKYVYGGCSGDLVWEKETQPFDGKFKLTLSDSSTVSAACDSSSSAITKDEVSTQYTPTLVSVVIGDCVNEIGEMAFYNCYNLTSVDIPDNVTNIEKYAISRCGSLTSVTIGNGVTTIGAYAFYDNNSLKSITIGSGCTYIGYWTFADCSGPINLTIYATTPPYVVSNAFQYSTINTIYVPAESINTYKSAAVWAGYADRIQAIS